MTKYIFGTAYKGALKAMKNRSQFDAKWHKLDNTANVFPIISNKNYSSVFRVSVILKNDVIPEFLQEALTKTLPLFSSFRVRLRRGAFWYYFENNKKQPLIEKEQTYPCTFINPRINKHFLFRVSYYKRRINLEVFHVITDGTGAIKFLKALTYNYLKLVHKEQLPENALKMPVVDVLSDVEDSYHKNYRKLPYKKESTIKAYKLKGEKLPLFTMSVIHGTAKVSALLELCKQRDVSLTQYIATLVIWCVYKEFLNEQPDAKPIQVNIPVNLRQFFNSTTEMNFFSYINVGLAAEKDDYTFDEMLSIIAEQFKNQLTKERLSSIISYNVDTERNAIVRFAPLFLKNLGVKIAYINSLKANTVVLSNLGRIEVIDEFKKYIDSFHAVIGVSKSEPLKLSVCSYEDKIVFTFTSPFKEAYFQRAFFRYLSNEGIEVIIESNGVNNELL